MVVGLFMIFLLSCSKVELDEILNFSQDFQIILT